MHIIGGEKKGHKLFGPGPEEIRPIQHLVRKALFDMARQLIEDSRFLDLFAGTGSVGLEALSRGASKCTFVDVSSTATNLIAKNLDKLGYTGKSNLEQGEVAATLQKFDDRARRFDVCFLGPPYGSGLAEKTLDLLDKMEVVRPGGVVIAEVFHKNSLSDEMAHLTEIDSREYGQTKLVFYRREALRK